MHCRWCWQRFEDDTLAEALRKVEEHEREKHAVSSAVSDGKD
jgi:predicted small metal-binding protein